MGWCAKVGNLETSFAYQATAKLWAMETVRLNSGVPA